MSENNLTNYQIQVSKNRKLWDDEAETFDNEVDHGLQNTEARQAWKTVLRTHITGNAGKALDIGCGTGSLSLLLAEKGYQVTGIDFSSRMIEIAREKTAKAPYHIDYCVMDAAFPTFEVNTFDLMLCRHVLWALTEPGKVLERWIKLLKPGAQLIMIEGFWFTGAGLHASDILSTMPANMQDVSVHDLSTNDNLWGKNVSDERFLISARLR